MIIIVVLVSLLLIKVLVSSRKKMCVIISLSLPTQSYDPASYCLGTQMKPIKMTLPLKHNNRIHLRLAEWFLFCTSGVGKQ